MTQSLLPRVLWARLGIPSHYALRLFMALYCVTLAVRLISLTLILYSGSSSGIVESCVSNLSSKSCNVTIAWSVGKDSSKPEPYLKDASTYLASSMDSFDLRFISSKLVADNFNRCFWAISGDPGLYSSMPSSYSYLCNTASGESISKFSDRITSVLLFLFSSYS